MHGRGQTVPYSHAPVHAPFHTPPCPPLVHPSSPLLCTPPFRVPFWLHAESTRHKGCLHAAPHIASPRCLVCAPPVGVLPQPSPLRLPLCLPSHWCATPAPSLAPPLSVCPVGCMQRVGAQWGVQTVFVCSPPCCRTTPPSACPLPLMPPLSACLVGRMQSRGRKGGGAAHAPPSLARIRHLMHSPSPWFAHVPHSPHAGGGQPGTGCMQEWGGGAHYPLCTSFARN